MANDLRKAAEMALEALECAYRGKDRAGQVIDAIVALEKALAQPVDAVNMAPDRVDETAKGEHEWVGLDDLEIIGMTCECVDDGTFNMDCARDFARAIEAKLKEKNVPQP